MSELLQRILPTVQKPARYTGGEYNEIKKDLNDVRHKENTGVSNQIILKNLKQLDCLGAKIILRCIMLRGINMKEDHLRGLRQLLEELSPQTKIELLPYHALGEHKYTALDQEVRMFNVPDEAHMMRLRTIFDGLA